MSGKSRTVGARRRLSASERRLAILRAGEQVFAERGYGGASMREISRAAGVTTPVLYDHFPSKRALQIALLEEQEAGLRAFQGRERGLEPGPKLGRALVRDFFSWVERHPYAWRMLFHDVPSDPEVLAAQRRLRERSAAQIVSFVALAPELPGLQGTGQLEREAENEILGRSIYAVINELAAWWFEHPETPREELADVAFGLLWSGLAAVVEPPRRDPSR